MREGRNRDLTPRREEQFCSQVLTIMVFKRLHEGKKNEPVFRSLSRFPVLIGASTDPFMWKLFMVRETVSPSITEC